MSDADVRQLVDDAFKAGKVMIQTHLKDDIVKFIQLAKALDRLGYQMIWVKHRGVVGATKRRGDNLAYSQSPTQSPFNEQYQPPKEVMTRAESTSNGSGI